ncbi:glycogen-binding subunit 76A-like isoform X2 [Aethina tumida]|nr:glycogen-binding subunit 76A-like isoform X2 [Aethina tumida]
MAGVGVTDRVFYDRRNSHVVYHDTREFQMTTERDHCGLSSLLPMSCRGRAEAFARSLHSRLSSLGTQNGTNGSANESSWLQLEAHDNHIALAQPRHSSNSEMFLDFGLLESPSPEEDIVEAELHRLLNKDNLKHSHSEDCHCLNGKEKMKLNGHLSNGSNDSDSSDGPFYDTNDFEQRLTNTNHVNGYAEQNGTSSHDSPSEVTLTQQDNQSINSDESFATTTENTVPVENSLSDETSTLSLKDGESDEINGSLTDIPQCGEDKDEVDFSKTNGDTVCNGTNCTDSETYVSSINIDKDLTVECPKIEEEVKEETPTCKNEEVLEIIQTEDKIEIRTSSPEEDEERIPRVRRCSSLKTGKTPPGTPGRKKIVRFADVLGLDLADVRTFLDEIPKIPNSAYEDLRDAEINDAPAEPQLNISLKCHGVKIDKVLLPLFQQPGGLPTFLDTVRDNCVCLENAIIDDPINFSIKGTVRVRNLDFHKSVHIRYTFDSWKTYHDVQGEYVQNSCDGFSDRFTFVLYARNLSVGQRLEFAVRFQCKGCQYWDSNKGVNYCFQCLPATHNTPYQPIGADVDHWGASFY